MDVCSGEHGGEEQKKSVLKKVKDKARKIKNTLITHGHDPASDEKEEEMETDPEIHGDPIAYESGVIRSTNLPMQTDVNLGKSSGLNNVSTSMEGDLSYGQRKEDPVAYSGGLLASNYETKVSNPAGEGKEAEVTCSPLIQSFCNLEVEEDEPEKTKPPPESGVITVTHDRSHPHEPVATEKPESIPAGENRPLLESATDYGHRVVEKLAPVYEKVAELAGAGVAAVEVDSVKEYLAEKLKPGEEDKELSVKITEALLKKDEPPVGTTVTESPPAAVRRL
ncbi:hypothetical protein M569_04156 [Genlisea aurea]|uniref:Uncharacterized protein n=1 Tax=Genlisea aurea TaxID=192259 RepID=S8CZS3_9LAMI|nr:hypothetical protein M569_04156 [Genlisea aurea]